MAHKKEYDEFDYDWYEEPPRRERRRGGGHGFLKLVGYLTFVLLAVLALMVTYIQILRPHQPAVAEAKLSSQATATALVATRDGLVTQLSATPTLGAPVDGTLAPVDATADATPGATADALVIAPLPPETGALQPGYPAPADAAALPTELALALVPTDASAPAAAPTADGAASLQPDATQPASVPVSPATAVYLPKTMPAIATATQAPLAAASAPTQNPFDDTNPTVAALLTQVAQNDYPFNTAVPDTSVPTATNTPVPPTATKAPPTATPVPPTATNVPPTATRVPPTATQVPPAATQPAPTAVPPTAVPVQPTAASPAATTAATEALPVATQLAPTEVPPTSTEPAPTATLAASPTSVPPTATTAPTSAATVVAAQAATATHQPAPTATPTAEPTSSTLPQTGIGGEIGLPGLAAAAAALLLIMLTARGLRTRVR